VSIGTGGADHPRTRPVKRARRRQTPTATPSSPRTRPNAPPPPEIPAAAGVGHTGLEPPRCFPRKTTIRARGGALSGAPTPRRGPRSARNCSPWARRGPSCRRRSERRSSPSRPPRRARRRPEPASPAGEIVCALAHRIPRNRNPQNPLAPPWRGVSWARGGFRGLYHPPSTPGDPHGRQAAAPPFEPATASPEAEAGRGGSEPTAVEGDEPLVPGPAPRLPALPREPLRRSAPPDPRG